jgi:hypothetical protein
VGTGKGPLKRVMEHKIRTDKCLERGKENAAM